MDIREINRSNWKRILKKRMYCRPCSITLPSGKKQGLAHILVMDEVREPLAKNGITIVEKGYTWLQIALKETHYWLTAMYNQADELVQIYFDITNGCSFEDPINPTFEDMFLDLVLLPDGTFRILDQDELEEALSAGLITRIQYETAKDDLEKLVCYLRDHSKDVIEYCNTMVLELKREMG